MNSMANLPPDAALCYGESHERNDGAWATEQALGRRDAPPELDTDAYSLDLGAIDRAVFLGSLAVPSPVKAADDRRQGKPATSPYPLYETAYIDGRRRRLEQASHLTPAAYDEVRLEVALEIMGRVSKALWYEKPDPKKPRPPFSLGELGDQQIATCTNYTLTASLMMAEVGLESYVGQANGHWFPLLRLGSGDTTRFWLIDPMCPDLAQDITDTMQSPASRIAQEVDTKNKAAVVMNTFAFTDRTDPNATYNTLIKTYGWLVADSERNVNDERLGRQRSDLVLTLLPRAEGLQTMIAASNFNRSFTRNDMSAALRHLTELSGRFPDIDARNIKNQANVERLAAALCGEGSYLAAFDAIESFYRSFDGLTHDVRVAVWEGDSLRIVADHIKQHLGELALNGEHEVGDAFTSLRNLGALAAESALNKYDEAGRRHRRRENRHGTAPIRRNDQMIRGKRDKVPALRRA